MKALFLLLLPLLAFAQEVVPEIIAEPNIPSLLGSVLKSIMTGQYVAGASALILILVYLFRKIALPKLGLGNGVLPYVTIGLGALVGILSNIVAGLPPGEAANIILVSGPGAALLWDSVFKLFVKKD